MHRADDSGLLVPPAYISADMPLAQKKAITAVRLAAAPIESNTKHSVHSVTYTQRKRPAVWDWSRQRAASVV
jgi:hypothetical protein